MYMLMPTPTPMLLFVTVTMPMPMWTLQYHLFDGTTLGGEEPPALRATGADLGIEQGLLASLRRYWL